jgi:molecular chaperone DnaK
MRTIAGIDLGTTYSSLAVLNAIGKPQIVPNADGDRIMPSTIYFDEDNPGVIRVGVEALNCRYINPDRSIRWIKRHIGDPSFHKVIDGHDWTPVELSALILKKLKQDAQAEVGEIQDTVISVPAHFDEVRRKATMDAGAAAGFNVIGIVNEPVAAALFYATSHDVCGKVLVYDLGGGTFDVTLMDVRGHEMNILCSHGDHQLGGVDFDQAILALFEQSYREAFKTDLITCGESRAKYEDEAEDVKKTLSRRPSAKKIFYGPAGSLKVEVTREQFEQAIAPLLARTDILIEVALEEVKLRPSDIQQVLLVGGSTRIPMVRDRLEKTFGYPPIAAVNVDECVALGAALHAGLTMIREKPSEVSAGIAGGLVDVKLTDVCNHSYGTLCAPIDKETGRRVVQNRIILKKNTALPCEDTQTFYTVRDGQTEIEVTITQGEDPDPRYVNRIATYKFELPPDRAAGRPVKVIYRYDVNQRMHCRFEDVESGRALEVDLSLDNQGNVVTSPAPSQANAVESVQVR